MTTSENGLHEPIAIVGMGCRWPGNVRDTTQFWEFLRNKVNGWKQFEAPQFSTDGFYHPNSDRPGSIGMKGAFLAGDDACLFDHTFFGMTALEVETLDPSQRKLLEVVYEAIEAAGDTWESVSGSKTGVFVGNFCLDHWMIQSRDWDNPRPYAFTGAGTSILANRVSYIFNLRGPSLTVDTACSSSMYALHLAMNALRAGDCDSAIVASANWIADPGVQIALDKLGALSESSRCHTFDARASGYARGEGFGAIYLKKIPLAMSHASPIRAVIRGTAINSNGRTGGITRPSASGQELVIREAYRNAGGLPYSETSYFECHGTGTYVGDPIEVAAVGRVFGPERDAHDPLLVGSVKSNVGHGEGASALASIMKVVLSLENGAIPPVYDLQERNPNIDFEGAKVVPVTEVMPWPQHRLKRASINSFGYGGANGHCIIDDVSIVLPHYVASGIYDRKTSPHRGYGNGLSNALSNGLSNGSSHGLSNGHSNSQPKHLSNGHAETDSNGMAKEIMSHQPFQEQPTMRATHTASTRRLVVLPLSAHNEVSFKENLDALARVIGKISLADVAYTLGARRSKLAQRSFCIVEQDDVAEGLVVDRKLVRAPLHIARLGFVFTGQGAQWSGMGQELFDYRIFRSAIKYLDEVLGLLSNAPAWSLYTLLSGSTDAKLFQAAEISQTVCTAVQVGLIDLLASWGVRPSGVAGHSSGEIAAAYSAGRITAAEAIVAAYMRGQAVSKNRTKGAMLAVGLGPDGAADYLASHEDGVKIAAINSPGSVTLSGETASIEEISARMTADGVFNRVLKTGDNAYHSHHMIPIGSQYIDMLNDGIAQVQNFGLARSELRNQQIPWFSSVTPSKSTENLKDIVSYWRANLQSPVLFSEALARLVNDESAGITALVEIGPHPALKSPVEQVVKSLDKTVAYTSTLKRGEDGCMSMLQCAGALFTMNAAVDFAAVNAVDVDGGLEHGCISCDLPPYRYTYGDLNYHESRASKEYRHRSILRHDLLGSKVVGNAKLRPQWRNILRVKDVPWLTEHRLVPDAVLPGAAYIAMAVEASLRIYNESPYPHEVKGVSLKDVAIKQTLVIPEDDHGIEVLTSMELADLDSWTTFSISSVKRDSHEWTEHSTGRIKIEPDLTTGSDDTTVEVPSVPRSVSTSAWYKKFLDIGLEYGPAFQPLTSIRTDPELNIAVASIDLHPTSIVGGESRYAVHPAALDGAIQLGLIACHGGQASDARTAFVPVNIGSLYISDSTKLDKCTAIARGERRGIRGAHLDLKMVGPDGQLLVHAADVRCISYAKEAKRGDTTFDSPFTRLVWKPDIRLMANQQARQLYPPPKDNVIKAPLWGITNRVAHFVVLSMYEKLKKIDSTPKLSGELGHFFDWIRRKGENDTSELMEEARLFANMGQLQQGLQELVDQAPEVMEVKIAKLLHDNMEDILYQRRTGMDVIIGEGLLTPLYQSGLLMTGIYPQLSQVLEGLAFSNPNLRILEIGGGTGGATRIALKAFTGPNGMKMYRDYTFTDISAGFLSSARESLAGFRDMSFSVFDAEKDPAEQGYERDYDLVIACQVLHATSNMHKTLSNCRKLLKPGGQLVMVETNQNFIVPGVVVGTFTGYWAGIPDGRVDAPFQDLPAWNKSLQGAGFTGLDLVLDDFPEPHNTTSIILSTARDESPTIARDATVYLYHGGSKMYSLGEHICRELQSRDVNVQTLTSLDTLSQGSRVIALCDDAHLMISASEPELKSFQHIMSIASSVVTITSCGTVKGRNADGAVISGLTQVLQNENPATQYASIDVDAENFRLEALDSQKCARAIVDVELGLQRDSSAADENDVPKDRQFCWQEGSMWISRHVPDTGYHAQYGIDVHDAEPTKLPLGTQRGLHAAFETPGVLNSWYFKPSNDLLQPLPRDHIDVDVRAWGLSASDLDNWAGRTDSDHLSLEYSGVVAAVGQDVASLHVGDYVYGIGKGHFGDSARVPAAFASKLASMDDLERVASIPMAYATAIYALEFVTQLRKGQTILVQGAAGPLGTALVTLAKAKGAEVFATAGDTRQTDSFAGDLALPSSNIISRLDERHLVRAADTTPKSKFDVIVCTSSPREMFSNVIAPLGHFIKIGRPHAPAPFESLSSMATYSMVDIMTVLEVDPVLGQALIQRVHEYYQQGLAMPIPSLTILDLGEFSPASLDLAKHVGGVVVTFGNPNSMVRMVPRPPTVTFDSEACYIVTGGLGGLGQTLVLWMAMRGARNFALLSRRHTSNISGAEDFVASLDRRGVKAQTFVCDVSNKEQVIGLVKQLAADRPVKGIVHAAVSYLDLSFDKVSAERWQEGLSAKVQGTKNLHEATLSMPLNFFVMTTSALSVYAFPTQGAYTAANGFQDAFARYRRKLGLPASTVSFSLVEEITAVGTDAITVDLFERNKTVNIGMSQFLSLLEPAFLNNETDSVTPWTGEAEDALSSANLHTYLNPRDLMARWLKEVETKGPSHSASMPRWYGDARVSHMMRAFRDAQSRSSQLQGSSEGQKNTTAQLRATFDAAILAGSDGRSEAISTAQNGIMNAVAEMLYVDLESIDPSVSVADIGVDSLIAAELRNWFLQALGANISMLDLLDPATSISARATGIVDRALDAARASSIEL